MAKAVLCPVCNGSGKYFQAMPNLGEGNLYEARECQGCFGRGWVEVSEDICVPGKEVRYERREEEERETEEGEEGEGEGEDRDQD